MTESGNVKLRGAWSYPQITAFLHDTVIPMRLAVSDGTGCPWVISLWFLFEDGVFWCATKSGARVAHFLASRPQCGFEVSGDVPPYRGIRGKGHAQIVHVRGAEVLIRLMQRYEIGLKSPLAQTLLAKIAQETAIQILPTHFTSWDFTRRMRNAEPEKIV